MDVTTTATVAVVVAVALTAATLVVVWQALSGHPAGAPVSSLHRIPHIALGRSARSLEEEMPRTVWTYWEGAPDSLVQACTKRLAATMPEGWVLRCMDRQSAEQLLPRGRYEGWMKSATHRADWLRLNILAEHGGVWIDASVVMVDDIEAVLAPHWGQASFFAYFNPLNMSMGDTEPVVEVSLMASLPHHPFVVTWRDEYAQVRNFANPSEYALARQAQGVNLQQGLRLGYHTIYHACQTVVQNMPHTLQGILLENAAYTYLRAQLLTRWDPDRLMFDLCTVPAADSTHRPVIKITSFERRLFKQYAASLHPGSLLGCLLREGLPVPGQSFSSCR